MAERYASNTSVSPEKSEMEIRVQQPDLMDPRFWKDSRGRAWMKATENQAIDRHEQEVRRLWRSLVLTIKAKLECVESGIETFEHAFMANIVLPDGRTVAEHVAPGIAEAYRTGKVPLMLGMGSAE